MCDHYADPEDPVWDFPEHGNEDPDNNLSMVRTSDPKDFLDPVEVDE